MPEFAVEGGLGLALVRGAADAAILLAFGTLLFSALVLPKALARTDQATAATTERAQMRLARWALAAATGVTLIWLVLESGDMADAEDWRATFAAIPAVARDTLFGHVILVTLAGLAATSLLLIGPSYALRWRASATLAGLVVAAQAAHGHAFAMAHGITLLLVSSVIHLLAAGAWLGGLPPLLIMAVRAPPRTTASAARWFTPLGKWCVGAIAATAAVQAWSLIDTFPGLVGTGYGWVAMGKLVLLAILTGFACANRYRFAPALLGTDPARARRILIRSIGVQTCFGLLVIAAAATLASLEPAIHEQPRWPFALRPSLVVLADPDLKREVATGVMELAGGIAALMAALVVRPGRWWSLVAGGVAAAVLWVSAMPHLELLLVEAYPTSFYHSPTGFSAEAIVAGRTLYAAHCVSCHGAGGQGDGPIASRLPVPPADLTAPHLWDHSDGELFWWLTHGMDAPEGGQSMPGFADTLSVDDRWDLIDDIRAHNAGVSMRIADAWPRPVRAPGFSMTCDGRSLDLADLRGRVVRLIVPGGADTPKASPPEAASGVAIVDVAVTPPAGGVSHGCAATSGVLLDALGILTGQDAASLAGTEFLVDPDGWLRARWSPGQPNGWDQTTSLLAAVQTICTTPIASEGEAHAHAH